MSWKRRKLLVPMDCSSSRRHSATSWGRVRLSRVSSSSNSLEKRMICSLLGRSPESRIYTHTHTPQRAVREAWSRTEKRGGGYTGRGRYLLEEGGELFGHVALGRLVAQGDLLHGVLEELGHLQLNPQLLLQPLLLHTHTHTHTHRGLYKRGYDTIMSKY